MPQFAIINNKSVYAFGFTRKYDFKHMVTFKEEKVIIMIQKDLRITSCNRKNKLYVRIWQPDETSDLHGIVQISHGMIEHIKRYDRFARFLVTKGYIVIANDHLGHGLTANGEEELGYMLAGDASEAMVRDLHKVTRYIRKRYHALPVFMVGHSMGSFLAKRYVMSYPNELNGLILLGSGYQPKVMLLMGYAVQAWLRMWKGEHYRSKLMQSLGIFYYNARIRNCSPLNNWITRDKEVLKAYNEDKYCQFIFTIKGYKTLFDTLWFIQKKKNIKKLKKELPIRFISGAMDPVGSYSYGVKRIVSEYQKCGVKKVDAVFYKDARHAVLHEIGYQKTQDDIVEWMERIRE